MKALPWILLLAATGASFEAGVRAYREGRFQESLDAFSSAVGEAGDDVSAELLFNQSLAALRCGRLGLSERAANAAAATDEAFESLRDFVLGNVAYRRGLQAEITASGPEAGPLAYQTALAYVRAARRHWERAAVSKEDWPAARRNVERALLKEAALVSKRDEAARRNKPRSAGDPKAKPKLLPNETKDPSGRRKRDKESQGDPEGKSEGEQADPDARALVDELSPAQVRRLLEKVASKEREKRANRRGRRAAARPTGDRDW